MEHSSVIRQILDNWTCALQIDEQSGESLVTSEDIDRLNDEILSVLGHYRFRILFCGLYSRIRNLNARITGSPASANIVHRL